MSDAPTIAADFTLTFEEFVEGYKLQRRRKRFLSGPAEGSVWLGCGVLAGLFVLIAIALGIATYMTGQQQVTSVGGGVVSDAPIVKFLTRLMVWPISAGILWLIAARSIGERRVLRRAIVIFLLVGAASALSASLTPEPATMAIGPPPTAGQSLLLPFLPLVVGLVGTVIFALDIYRRTIHVAWDGSPQLRQPYHIEATPDRWIIRTLLVSSDYAWEAVVSYSEGKHVLVLSYSATTFHVIPKRALDDPGLAAFRALLAAKTVNADSGQRQGFDVIPQPVIPADASARPRG
jgi:YcxB-like protein